MDVKSIHHVGVHGIKELNLNLFFKPSWILE
jgi:hypothetical protein